MADLASFSLFAFIAVGAGWHGWLIWFASNSSTIWQQCWHFLLWTILLSNLIAMYIVIFLLFCVGSLNSHCSLDWLRVVAIVRTDWMGWWSIHRVLLYAAVVRKLIGLTCHTMMKTLRWHLIKTSSVPYRVCFHRLPRVWDIAAIVAATLVIVIGCLLVLLKLAFLLLLFFFYLVFQLKDFG